MSFGQVGPLGMVRRLLVTMPPRHGKSELGSKYFPLWYLDRFPDRRVILSSYQGDYATEWSIKTRDLARENIADLSFGLNPNIQRGNFWMTDQGGSMQAVGVGGSITGKGADLKIIDDPVKNNEDAMSQASRDKQWDWWLSTASTRLEPGAIVVLIMTRWHEDDMGGRVIGNFKDHGEEWHELRFPAIAEVDEPQIGRLEGEALWPGRYPLPELKKIKQSKGAFWWSAMYQQRPAPIGGGMFKLADFGRYETDPEALCELLREQKAFIIQSWDTASKTGEANDQSACTTWAYAYGFEGGRIGKFLLDSWAGKAESPELKRKIRSMAMKWNPRKVLIEDKSSGIALAQQLKAEASFPWPIETIEPCGDKVMRASLEVPAVEAGQVYLPEAAPWLVDLEDQVKSFPVYRYKDTIDSVTQGLMWMRVKGEQMARTAALMRM